MNHNHTTAARVALDVLVSHVEGLDDGGEARLYVIPAKGQPVQVSAGPDL